MKLIRRAGSIAVVSATVTVPLFTAGAPLAHAVDATTNVTRYTVAVTNVRTGPGTSYGVSATVPAGTAVSGTVQANGWILVTAPARFAGRYVSAAVLASTAPVTGSPTSSPATAPSSTSAVTKYTSATTNVRTGPATTYTVAGTLPSGTAVSGTVQANGWILVTAPARFAGRYVSSAVLASTAPTPAPVTAIPTSGMVTGWVVGDYHVVVNVRSGPGSAYPVVRTIAKGSAVSGVLTDGWLRTANGYVNAGVVEFVSSNIYANNARLPQNELCAIPAAYNSPTQFSVRSPATGKTYSYDGSTVRYLSCAALPGLVALENAYLEEQGHVARIDLGYRSYDEQTAWAADPRYNASAPGTSNHGWGLAVDFKDDGSADDGTNEFASQGAGFAWLSKNATRFGYAVDPVVPERLGYWKSETFHWNFIG